MVFAAHFGRKPQEDHGKAGRRRAEKPAAERRPHWRRNKSLVSSTQLKGQMESQWGSLPGSHYWNTKGFFFFIYFTHRQGQSWKQLALRDSSVFFLTEWNKWVCLHSHSHTLGDTAAIVVWRWRLWWEHHIRDTETRISSDNTSTRQGMDGKKENIWKILFSVKEFLPSSLYLISPLWTDNDRKPKNSFQLWFSKSWAKPGYELHGCKHTVYWPLKDSRYLWRFRLNQHVARTSPDRGAFTSVGSSLLVQHWSARME